MKRLAHRHRLRPAALLTAFVLILAPSQEAAMAQTVDPYAGFTPGTLELARSSFYRAVDSLAATESAIAELVARLGTERRSWPLVARAYRASLEGLVGKHSPGLLEKFNRVNAALEQWRGLVEAAPDSLELRFLRYSFFSQLPAMFGVGSYLAPDREALVAIFEKGGDARVPRDQALDMVSWLLKEGKLSAPERRRLELAASRL
ncbi:MAG TPA: hypothetical protein PKW82_09905 [Spirochaetales bacterium]|nr:hypothetical protein [Spirochaetales bacterium]